VKRNERKRKLYYSMADTTMKKLAEIFYSSAATAKAEKRETT